MGTKQLSSMAAAIVEGLRERGDFEIAKENIANAFATIAEMQALLGEEVECAEWMRRITNLTRTLASYNELVDELAKTE